MLSHRNLVIEKYFVEYVISNNPINPKEKLLKLKSFQTIYINRPELGKKLKGRKPSAETIKKRLETRKNNNT